MLWSNYFSNPYSITIKKFLYEVLKERYVDNEKFIDRICSQLVMQEDVQSFVKIINDAHQKGYILALEQHREALAKVGMSVKITNEHQIQSNKIFSQEKSG